MDWKAARVFDIPSHVRLSEWLTVLVLTTASGGVAVRFSTAYPRDLSGGIVAFLLAVNASLVWAAFHNNSVRRQRAIDAEWLHEYRE